MQADAGGRPQISDTRRTEEEKQNDSGYFILTEFGSECQSYKVLDQAIFHVNPCKRAIECARVMS